MVDEKKPKGFNWSSGSWLDDYILAHLNNSWDKSKGTHLCQLKITVIEKEQRVY